MNLITSKLLKDLDQLKLERYPLPAHYAMKADSHAREVYAVFLAGVLLSGERISDTQTRLFQMLLDSLSLENSQASLYERAKETDQDLLREFFRITDEHDLAQSFLADAVVLCRIEHELTEQQVILFSEIADSLKLSIHQMGELMALVAIILGLPSDKAFPIDYDYSKFSVWDEFTYKLLTAEQLQKGFISGRWFLNSKIDINSHWSICDAIVNFIEDAEINTRSSGVINIKNVVISNPVMKFYGSAEVKIENSKMHGDYFLHDKKTSITLSGVRSLLINKVDFSTKNARSLLIENTKASLNDCSFNDCGNKYLIGGAVAVDGCNKNNFNANRSSFLNCVSRLGHAVKMDYMNSNSFVGCLFKGKSNNINSIKDADELYKVCFSGLALFADEADGSRIIDDCEFNNVSIRCQSFAHFRFWGEMQTQVNNSRFINSRIMTNKLFYDEFKNHVEIKSCEIDIPGYDFLGEGFIIECDETPQKWWVDFE